MSNGFTSPDKFRDEAKSQAEEFDRKSNSYSTWKPKKGETPNCVRILPAKDNASFHLKVGKHFIHHEDKWEVFVCLNETYGEPCPTCEKYLELRKTDKEAAAAFKPQVRGVFNIIDRANEESGVQRWEAPASKVWRIVLEWFKGNTKFNNICGTAKDPLEGRDLFIIFKPDEDPGSMYNVWPNETSPLGTPEQIKKWLDECEPLIAEKLYPKIDYEDAKTLTFGSPQERAEVRRALKETTEEVEEDEGEENEVIENLKKQLIAANMKIKLAEAKANALSERSPEEEKIEKSATARAKKEEEEEVEEEETQEDPEVTKLKEEVAKADLKLKEAETKVSTLKEKGNTKKTPKAKKDMSTPEDTLARVEKIRAAHSKEK